MQILSTISDKQRKIKSHIFNKGIHGIHGKSQTNYCCIFHVDFFMFKLSLKAPQPLFLSDLGRDILILGALNFGAKIKGS